MSTDAASLPRLPVADGRRTWQAVVDLTTGRRLSIAGIMALLLVAAASTLVLPLTIGWIVDTVAAQEGGGVPPAFMWQLTALAAAALVGGAVELVGVVTLGRLVETMTAELRERFVASALRLPVAEVERVGIGDVVTRAADDTRNVSEELPAVLPTITSAGFTVVLVLAGTAAIDWRFTTAFVLAAPLYLLALRWYLPAVPPVYATLRSSASTRGERVLTTLTALPTVAAFGAGPDRVEAIRAATWDVGRWQVRARIMQNRLFGRINAAEAVGLLLVLGCGFLLAAHADATLGQLTAASLLFLQLTGPLAALVFLMDDLQSAASSLSRVVGVTALEPPLATPRATPADAHLVVDVQDVHFAYRPGHPVLRGVDLTVRAGEHVAVVGASGSGKTTLARLVAGSRTPDSGSIATATDDHRIASLDQDGHVFATTLRENLTITAPDATDDVLVEALRAARADTWLAELPDGLDTVLGEGGQRLGGGAEQLLALARLSLRDPALVILDEATADADSRTAAALDAATQHVLAGRAALVVAHRLSQARACDRVVVMDCGTVVEEGTHDALLAAGGRYAQLWDVYRAGRPG